MLHCAQRQLQPSSVFQCPGTRLEHAAPDAMRSGDLGVFQDALGSIFWQEVTNKAWRGCISYPKERTPNRAGAKARR